MRLLVYFAGQITHHETTGPQGPIFVYWRILLGDSLLYVHGVKAGNATLDSSGKHRHESVRDDLVKRSNNIRCLIHDSNRYLSRLFRHCEIAAITYCLKQDPFSFHHLLQTITLQIPLILNDTRHNAIVSSTMDYQIVADGIPQSSP